MKLWNWIRDLGMMLTAACALILTVASIVYDAGGKISTIASDVAQTHREVQDIKKRVENGDLPATNNAISQVREDIVRLVEVSRSHERRLAENAESTKELRDLIKLYVRQQLQK